MGKLSKKFRKLMNRQAPAETALEQDMPITPCDIFSHERPLDVSKFRNFDASPFTRGKGRLYELIKENIIDQYTQNEDKCEGFHHRMYQLNRKDNPKTLFNNDFIRGFSHLVDVDTLTDCSKVGCGKSGKVYRKDKHAVVKITGDPDDDCVAHDAIVGLTLNKLRDRVPNFSYIYDIVVREIEGYDNNAYNLVLMENLEDSVFMYEFVKTCTEAEFFQVYIQVINALNLAYKEFDFSHYDLHGDNVLIKKLDYEVSIPIYQTTGTKYLKTCYLAKIIDYGYSHIRIDGFHVGAFGLESYGVNPFLAKQAYDSYKLFLTVLHSAYSRMKDGKSVVLENYEVFNRVYEFFGETSRKGHKKNLKDRVEAAEKMFDVDSSGDPFVISHDRELSHENLLDFLLKNVDVSSYVGDSVQEGCVDVQKLSAEKLSLEEFVSLSFDTAKLPETKLEYENAVNALEESETSNRHEILRWLRKSKFYRKEQ